MIKNIYIKIPYAVAAILFLVSISTLIKAFVPRFSALETPFILYPIIAVILITFGSFLATVLKKGNKIWGLLIFLYGLLIIFSIFYALQSEV